MNKRYLLNTKKAMRLGLMLCLCYSLVGLYSCRNEDNGMYNKGTLRFQMEADTTLVNSTLNKSSRTSHFSDFEDPKTYKVVISQNSEVVAEFESYEEMPEALDLEEGQYSIEASKGTETTAAFESPYFSGKSDFNIVKDKTTSVEVTASLQNSLVTVNYSSDFLETYKDYTLSLKTDKMDHPLIYEKGESRAMYFQSDAGGTKLTIGMSLENVYGKEVEYTATTTIKPKQWSKLTVSTDGNGLNGIALDVTLDDGTKEPVYINIGIPDFMEQLKGAPKVTCEAFEWSTNLSMEQPSECTKDECSESAMVNIIAGGKINQVLLNLKDNENNILINNYDLVNLTDGQKTELKEKYGFEVPEDALKQGSVSGSIDFKSIIASLLSKVEDSFYELSLTVIDEMPTPNKTVKSVKINVPKAGDNTITWNFTEDLSFDYASYDQGEQKVEVNVPIGIKTAFISIDGLGIENQDISQVINGINVDKSADKIILTFTQEWFNSLFCNENKTAKQYTVTLNITDNLDRIIEDNSRSFTVNFPVFEWASEIDAFAKYAIVDIKTNNPGKVSFYNGGIPIKTDDIVRLDPKVENIVTFVIKNLSPTTTYNLTAKYNNDDRLALEQKSFETEKIETIPNGNFESWEEEGQRSLHPGINPFSKETVIAYKPIGWSTVNYKTFTGVDLGSLGYTVNAYPSTTFIQENGENKVALIRTIGWAKGGGNDLTGKSKSTSSGRLFLGSYNFDFNNYIDNYNYGIEFNSRPHKVRAKYKYIPYSDDEYKAWVIIKNGNTEIGYGELIKDKTDGYETLDINITYFSHLKADKIIIVFASSYKCNDDYQTENSNMEQYTECVDSHHYEGSQLYIDDVELIYDYE